jgi:hypothetical protein
MMVGSPASGSVGLLVKAEGSDYVSGAPDELCYAQDRREALLSLISPFLGGTSSNRVVSGLNHR